MGFVNLELDCLVGRMEDDLFGAELFDVFDNKTLAPSSTKKDEDRDEDDNEDEDGLQ